MKLTSALDGGMIERMEGSGTLQRPRARPGSALATYGQDRWAARRRLEDPPESLCACRSQCAGVGKLLRREAGVSYHCRAPRLDLGRARQLYDHVGRVSRRHAPEPVRLSQLFRVSPG